jgi:hypothetical protein
MCLTTLGNSGDCFIVDVSDDKNLGVNEVYFAKTKAIIPTIIGKMFDYRKEYKNKA